MTLGTFADILGESPRWVQNAAARLGQPFEYTVPMAQRLALARELHLLSGMPLPEAYQHATDALHSHAQRVVLTSPGQSAQLIIDVDRFRANFNVALARTRNMYAPKMRGRRSHTTTPEAFGVDMGSLRANLRSTPTERLERLQSTVDFLTAARQTPRPR